MRLGRYHLSDCLGGGPTGEVYRAKVYGVAGLDREFAVKRFHAALVADSRTAGMIQNAARLYGALEHPRVARLHELGEASGHTFVASEFVEGTDLGQLIEQGPLPAGTAAQLIVQVGRTVGYAHGRGLSHLGLCPTNIICSVRGDVKVTDFGFLPARLPARPAEDPTLLSRLFYLAPEQLEGKPTSPATDVYQLGVIAYQLMVGRKPYAQTKAAALSQAMLSQVLAESGLGKAFDKLFKRALAKSPFERFPDTGALADALEAALRTTPLPGSLSDAGKAVSKRQSFLLTHRDSQASGVLSFPIPSPPSAVRVKTPPPPIPSAKLASTKLGLIPAIVPRATPTGLGFTNAPYAGDTDVDAEVNAGGGRAFTDQMTIPEHALIADAPELSEDILLGPAGTDQQSNRGQFIGGNLTDGSDDDAETLIRDENSREAIDEGDTLVKADVGVPQAPGSREELREPAVLEFDSQPDDDLDEIDGLDGIEDEVSELLQIPMGAPFAMEVPQLPTRNNQHLDGPRGMPREIPPPLVHHPSPPGHRLPAPRAGGGGRKVLYFLVLAGLVVGGFLGYRLLTEEPAKTIAAGPGPALDAGSAVVSLVSGDASAAAAGDAGQGAVPETALVDASPATAASVDAGVAVVALPGDALEIDSTPRGAHIYLDGTLVGNTPLKLDPSDDSHRIAVILPGYLLYTGEIQGKGIFKFDLSEVSPLEGPFGIKVRCMPRNKDRYYIYVDGLPVGQLCPSERIGVTRGDHEVEIYDPITDSRRVFSVVAEDTSRSHRVLVD